MPDKLTPEQLNTPKVTTARSRNMVVIRAKNTKPEIISSRSEVNDYTLNI